MISFLNKQILCDDVLYTLFHLFISSLPVKDSSLGEMFQELVNEFVLT